MKRKVILLLFLFACVTILHATDNSKCIIIGFEPRYIKVSDSISDALKDSGLEVERCFISRKGISFTVDSLLETLGKSSDRAGLIGLGYTGGIAAAEIAAKSKAAYLILISTPAICGKRFNERLLIGSTYSLDLSAKEEIGRAHV